MDKMEKTKVLKPEEDVYGQELLAHYNGKNSFEIVERDDGYYSVSSGVITYFSSYDEWAPQEKKALEYVHGRVLDIGCGAGRHSLYLQEKGFEVLGIDNSPLAIKVCKLRGLKNAKVMSIDELSSKLGSFDTILMMGANFGLFGSFKKAQRLLKEFHTMTSKRSLIIAHTRDPYNTENLEHLAYHDFNKKRGRMSGQIRIRFGKCLSPWFDYLFVSVEELEEILEGTGWKVRELIGSENPTYYAIIEKKNHNHLNTRE